MTSLKLLTYNTAASFGKLKKQRITKVTKGRQHCSKQTSDLMFDLINIIDVINTVGSQSTDSDVGIEHSDTDIKNTEGSNSIIGLICRPADADVCNVSFSADAIQASNNLRAVIEELPSVINQQKVRISSIEHQLTNITSTLQNISDVQQSEQR